MEKPPPHRDMCDPAPPAKAVDGEVRDASPARTAKGPGRDTVLRNFTAGGVPFRAWLTLIPPTEAASGSSCSVPADSPLTPFNETAMFNQSLGLRGCQDYRAWAEVTGKLASLYPALRYLNVDDLTHNPGT